MKNFAAAVCLLLASVASFAVECPSGKTLADWPKMICTTKEVTYVFHPDFFESSGNVKVSPKDITVRRDPNGPYTLLFSSPLFKVSSGQHIHVEMTIEIHGATKMNAWLHKCHATGKGRVYGTQEIMTNPDLLVKGIENVIATAQCTDGTSDEPQQGEKFDPNIYAVGKDKYNNAQIIIDLDGGVSGTAQAQSLGTHFNP